MLKTYVIYSGPSNYDGKPIVVLAQIGSRNRKTGNMLQTFILLADIDPLTANRTGADVSICGDCVHMGKPNPDATTGQAIDRTCYVTLIHAPASKYRAYRNGSYPEIAGHANIAALGAGHMVRLGTYGDPAAVPQYVWDSLVSDATGWTAYTHGKVNPAPDMIMTSADNKAQAVEAWERGERTFRVLPSVKDMIKGKEILCPASEEAGRKASCISCKLCAGASVKGKSVAIVAHGTSKRKLIEGIA
jgi:hypothetical protein